MNGQKRKRENKFLDELSNDTAVTATRLKNDDDGKFLRCIDGTRDSIVHNLSPSASITCQSASQIYNCAVSV